jgi:DNA-binding NarL/FixJ family response regulator
VPGDRQQAAPDGLSTLTRRELDVLELLAAGRTNGQIATTLYISTKTASVHVSNILRKLGVANRVEAAAFAHRVSGG